MRLYRETRTLPPPMETPARPALDSAGRAGEERERIARYYMQPQQTGVPFIIMQQVQPAFIMEDMQSQQA